MRVFVLGAGFSKPCGLPLATELLDQAIARTASVVPGFEGLALIADLLELYKVVFPGVPVGIEEFFDFTDLEVEWHRLNQHTENLGRRYGAVAWDHAESVEHATTVLHEHALEIINEKSDLAPLGPIDRFLEHVSVGDIILSFNFDRLVERTMGARPIHFGLPDWRGRKDAVNLLKLHGSVDWLYIDRDELPDDTRLQSCGCRLLYKKPDTNADENGNRDEAMEEPEYRYCLVQGTDTAGLRRLTHDYFPRALGRLAMPRFGGSKRLHGLPGLGVLWRLATAALVQADQIVFVGFRMSPQDMLAQLLFAKARRIREEEHFGLPKVTVVDPSSADVAGRIEKFFPVTEQIDQYHEVVDWSTVCDRSKPI